MPASTPLRTVSLTGSLVGSLAISLLGSAPASAGDFTSVSIDRYVNASLQQAANSAFPSGSPVILGGVPFNIAARGNNYIETSSFPGTVTLTFPIGLRGVAGVHTLINTYWGETGSGTLASLTFDFDDGSSFVKPLDGNVDIRDYYQNFFTNTINGTTTINVVATDNDASAGPNPYRLDKQFVDLSAFSDRTLVSMTLIDAGSNNVQRTFLAGITVETTEPSCGFADFDCDGVVGPADLAILLGGWGTAGATDLDEDGTTGSADLALLLGAWSA